MASISLDHHVYDQPSDKWLRCPSKSQPFVRLSMAVQKEDYKHFGFHLFVQPNTVSVDAMADTGCQSCLVGFKLVEKMGLSSRDLIPVNMRMHSADNRDKLPNGSISVENTVSHLTLRSLYSHRMKWNSPDSR